MMNVEDTEKKRTCRKCQTEKKVADFTRQFYKSKKWNIGYWRYNYRCKKCALVHKKIMYHTNKKIRNRYKKNYRKRKRINAEEKEQVQDKIDRIKYLMDHRVYLFPHESKERKELNKAILDIMKIMIQKDNNKSQQQGLTWQPILPFNAEPVKIMDLFDLFEKAIHVTTEDAT